MTTRIRLLIVGLLTAAVVLVAIPTHASSPPVVVSTTGQFVTSDRTLSGWASDDSAVVSVRIAVRDASLNWLQADGTFGPSHKKFDAALANPQSSFTDWSYVIPPAVPDGRYWLSVRATDDAGEQVSLRPWQRFKLDTTGPVIDVAFGFGATIAGPMVRLAGVVEDLAYPLAIWIAIKDRATGDWLQPDGSWGPRHNKTEGALLTCRPERSLGCVPGTPNAADDWRLAWTHEVNLPPGDYSLSVRAVDTFGHVSSLRPWRWFTVDPAVDPLPSPSTFSPGTVFHGPDVTLTGSAIDDVGVGRVLIGIRDRDTGLWSRGGSWYDSPSRMDAVMTDPRALHTDWSIEVELPDGRYALSVRAFDTQGYSASIAPWVKFEVDTT